MGRKWANIVAKKTAKDGATSKVYAKFGVEIYVANLSRVIQIQKQIHHLNSLLIVRNKLKYQSMLLIKLLTKLREILMKPLLKDVTKVLDQMAQ